MPAVIVGPLRVGSTGASVRLVQGRLNVTVDGSFGSRTEAAVRAFQSSNGLTCDGIVGALTAAALGFPFQAGSPPAPGPRPPALPRGQQHIPHDARPSEGANAAAQILEAIAQSIIAFGNRLLDPFVRLGSQVLEVVSMVTSSIRQVASFLRAQAAQVGRAIEFVAATLDAPIRTAFRMVESMLTNVVSLLRRLLGLEFIVERVERVIGRVRHAVNQIVDLALNFFRGVGGLIETFAGRVVAILVGALSELASL